MEPILIIGAVVVLALLFELTNGWNDAANAIATIVSTRVLKPRSAVIMSASFNILGALLSTKVAATVSGMVNASMISPSAVAAAMVAGALWNAAMTRLGMPISASHALLGSVAGAAVASAGLGALKWSAIMKAVHGLWSSPLLGMVIAIAVALPLLKLVPRFRLQLASLMIVGLSYSYKPLFGAIAVVILVLFYLYMRYTHNRDENEYWKKYQLISSTLMSLAHGTNDAQKVMGVITMALVAGQFLPEGAAPPMWVILSCATVMGLGTYMGGWEVIKTLGEKLTDLRPIHGFAAETAAATVLSTAAHLGVPVSTTHTITGCIMGVGVSKLEVNWKVASKIGMAWVFTIPVTFAVGYSLGAAILHFGLWPVLIACAVMVGLMELVIRMRKAAQAPVPVAVADETTSD
ncbi:MAG TPA: inorganic phosphate transporter [Symbiobacteriaceae bacterium]|nr:inorganic phosphate transporter [Symbiobacteriaceae bacterium]